MRVSCAGSLGHHVAVLLQWPAEPSAGTQRGTGSYMAEATDRLLKVSSSRDQVLYLVTETDSQQP